MFIGIYSGFQALSAHALGINTVISKQVQVGNDQEKAQSERNMFIGICSGST